MEEKMIVLGTGNASVTRCYNTCWILQDEQGRYFMIDAGGGNGVLTQLEKLKISPAEIHHLFLTHKHTDHLFGVIWMIRTIAQMMMGRGNYEGDFHIYCHEELVDIIMTFCRMTLSDKIVDMIGKRILIHVVEDGQVVTIHDYQIHYFDIQSHKAKQFGFVTRLNNGKKLMFCGDEPLKDHCRAMAQDADWLLHEAFCLYEERDIFKPYEISHSTVKDCAQMAQELHVKNLLIWHTEDKNIRRRKSLYKKEARRYFKGKIYVPYDREVIKL
ncbi:MAG: MBL fold metallo-hydrolase [Lachnospiraceae bacterium]|nr:MBL fold metallo-hydrolase [Lachnospiraceae bacterium]